MDCCTPSVFPGVHCKIHRASSSFAVFESEYELGRSVIMDIS